MFGDILGTKYYLDLCSFQLASAAVHDKWVSSFGWEPPTLPGQASSGSANKMPNHQSSKLVFKNKIVDYAVVVQMALHGKHHSTWMQMEWRE